MTTNQISQNNLINVDTNANEHYLNLIFNSQVATQIGNCAKEGFTSKNVLILGMLLYINEIKNIPKYITKESSEYIVANYKNFFTYFYNLIANLASVFATKQICYQPIEFINEPEKINFKIKVINEFVNGFINFLKDNKNIDNVSYMISPNKSIQFADMETLLLGETWSNIKIHYNTITIRLSSELDLTFENNKLKSFNSIPIGNFFSQSNGTISKELYEKLKTKARLIHLINDWVIFVYVYEMYQTIETLPWKTFPKFNYGNYLEYHKSLVQFNSEHIQTPNNLITWESVIYSIIIHYFSNTGMQSTYVELLIIFELIYKMNNLQICDSTGNKIIINARTLFSNDFSELYLFDINLKVPESIQEWIKKNNTCLTTNFKYKTGFSNLGLKFFNANANDQSKGTEFKIFNCSNSILEYMSLPGTHWFNSIINIWKQKNPSIKANYPLETLIDIKQLEQMRINMCFTGLPSSKYYSLNIYKGQLEIPINNQLNGRSNGSSSMLNISNTANTTNTANSNTTNEITFVCEGNTNKITVEEINGEFNSFISDIKKYEFAIGDKNEISICKIKLEKTTSKKEIPNPEYQAYLEKKELLENIKLEKSDVLVKELANIPPKTIMETQIKKEVKTQHVNSGYKTFDTMYLRETDEKKLLSVLSKFKSNKELLKSLGLPNKLCVLLDGLPGTGKSSTILTIASYLKKDIYYLSFGDTIESNEDLQMIFDHVVKNCNGGIIVAEDIDAVGTLLHNRTGSDTNASTNNKDIEETPTQKLSLAYVLNLLQGTITPDNLIFIATTNHIEKLDPAFYRHGRFDARITFKLADHFQLNKIYYKFFNRNIPADLLKVISEDKFTPAQFIFTIKDYISEDFPDDVILSSFIEKNLLVKV